MTDPCCSLSVIFCGFISHLIGSETINIQESFSSVHSCPLRSRLSRENRTSKFEQTAVLITSLAKLGQLISQISGLLHEANIKIFVVCSNYAILSKERRQALSI